jgi:thiamine-phosphate pyrophosphorylase
MTPNRPSLPRPCLALITDRRRSALPLVEAVAAAIAAAVDLVQLREGDLAPGELLALALELRTLTARRALFVVNADVALALAVGADGVHLPERGTALAEVRARGGARLLIGRSVHSVAAARHAAAEGADYLQVGAIFPTASHPGHPAAGPDLVRSVRAAVNLPLLAVGGITHENAAQVLVAGADGVAVIGAILGRAAPEAATQRLRLALHTLNGDDAP